MADEPSSDDPNRPRPAWPARRVLFADVVGFTDVAESIGPERAYFVVTGAVRILDEIARRHGGAVDKYLSDCLLVVFGYPVPIAATAARPRPPPPSRCARSCASTTRASTSRSGS